MRDRTTIHDVAQHAGVSKVTVSYVLNGRGSQARISRETEARVLKSAEALHYRPNAIARMLATSRTDTVAVLFQRAQFFSSWSSFVSEVMRGITGAVVAEGLDLLMHTKATGAGEEEAGTLLDGRVDGVLALRDAEDPTVMNCAKAGLPMVLFFTRPIDIDLPYVDVDNYQGGRIAAEHFLACGHKRFGVVTGPAKSPSVKERTQGFLDRVHGEGLQVPDEAIVEIKEPSDDLSELEALLVSRSAPTALFVWSDDVSFECLKLTKKMNLRVPGEVSVIGFDSSPACDLITPHLTSVKQPIFDIAGEATRLLAQLIRGDALPTSKVFAPNLDVRDTVGPPRHL